MEDVRTLQQQLAERIAALDAQRKEEAAKFAADTAQRNAIADMERAESLKKYQEMEAQRKAKKEAEAQAEQKRAQEALKAQKQLESDLAAADEAKRKFQEQLAWIQAEIAKQEFVEEQHRKRMQSQSIAPPSEYEPTEINVEHPTAPDNKGEAVQGTDGDTPDSPLMSEHLKHILRQATRQY